MKDLGAWSVQAVLMECTVSSIHVTKTDLDEGILSFWLILVSCHLLNGQLRQQNVFYCFFTVHNCYFREREGERACVFVCVDSCKERCECVITVCGAVHSPQSTLWKTRRYLTNSVVSSNKAVISDADLLSFLTHTLKCGQWRNNKSNINGEENQTLTFVPQIFIHSLSHIQKHFPVY